MDARDLDAGTVLPRRPRDKAAVEAFWRLFPRWEVRLSAAFIGSRPDRDYTAAGYPAVTLKDYFLADADISYQAGPKTRVFLRIDNLFDERYETVYGYGTPRLSAYGGVRIGFGDKSNASRVSRGARSGFWRRCRAGPARPRSRPTLPAQRPARGPSLAPAAVRTKATMPMTTAG